MSGMAESIALLICIGYDNGYKVDDGKYAKYTLKSIVAFLKKKQ